MNSRELTNKKRHHLSALIAGLGERRGLPPSWRQVFRKSQGFPTLAVDKAELPQPWKTPRAAGRPVHQQVLHEHAHITLLRPPRSFHCHPAGKVWVIDDSRVLFSTGRRHSLPARLPNGERVLSMVKDGQAGRRRRTGHENRSWRAVGPHK